jgi:hypothetical protein
VSFNRQLLQQRQGPIAINRIVRTVNGDYVMSPDDDVLIEQGNGFLISLPPDPLIGDVHSVCTPGGAATLDGNGFTINGAVSIGLVLFDNAICTFMGPTGWTVQISNPTPGGSLPGPTLFAGDTLAWGLTTLFVGMSTSVTVTIAGAVVGNLVTLAPPATWPVGLLASGYVSAPNTVILVASNDSGADQDIPILHTDLYNVRIYP